MDQTIVIPKKKRKTAAVGASVFLLALSGLFIWVLLSFVFPQLPGFLKLKIAAVTVIAAVTLIAVFFLIKQTFSKKPGLIVDENGIIDNTNLLSVGFVPWNDITAVKQTQNGFKQKLMILTVLNPEMYIYKDRSKQAGRKAQHTQFGSPIIISAGNLDYDTNELISVISHKVQSPSDQA